MTQPPPVQRKANSDVWPGVGAGGGVGRGISAVAAGGAARGIQNPRFKIQNP